MVDVAAAVSRIAGIGISVIFQEKKAAKAAF
jgi:hypothetical protein